MRTALMVLALLAAPAFAAQAVWKWVDEKGVTHYADRPVPGAQRVEINVGSRADSVQPTPSPSPSTSSSAQSAAPAMGYQEFEIWRPGNQDSIINTGGAVEVQLRLEPSLRPGHSISLYLDGRVVDSFPPTALEYTLQEVPRGEHSLVAVVQDPSGKRLQETPTVTFNVRQTSIAQPPVGPTLRQPPPKPRPSSNKPATSQPSYNALNGQRAPIDPRTNAPVRSK
jgi:hypothetical protein